MKINVSRQNIYLLVLSVFLLVFVLIFAFALLIPEGKEYRNKMVELKKESIKLQKFENFRDEILERLTELKSEKRHVITAFDTGFNPQRFEKIHKDYFNSLTISPKIKSTKVIKEAMDEFDVYEVNTTSKINSPTSFYGFLDSVNKSDWIISINFPIEFKREDEMIRSSFTMKVYNSKGEKDSKSTTAE